MVQFVLESGAYCAISDDPEQAVSSSNDHPQPGHTSQERVMKKRDPSNGKDHPKENCLTFYTSSEMRQVLKNLITLASSEMMSKGFKQL